MVYYVHHNEKNGNNDNDDDEIDDDGDGGEAGGNNSLLSRLLSLLGCDYHHYNHQDIIARPLYVMILNKVETKSTFQCTLNQKCEVKITCKKKEYGTDSAIAYILDWWLATLLRDSACDF